MISHHQAKNFLIFMWKKLRKQIPPQRLQLSKYYLSGWCRAPAISRRWDRRHIRMFAKTLITVFAGFFLCSRESLSQVVFPDASGATVAPAISTVANFFGITNAYPTYPASPFIQTSKCLEVAIDVKSITWSFFKTFACVWIPEDVQLLQELHRAMVQDWLTSESSM